MDKPVRTQTNLTRRGAVYYFRARFPTDLISYYKRDEVLISLKTKDKQEAISKARFQRLRLDHEFTQARALVGNQSGYTFNEAEYTFLPSKWHSNDKPLSPAPTLPNNVKAEYSLQELLEYWTTQRPKRANTIIEAKAAIKRLMQVTQDKPARFITKSDIVQFKDNLINAGKSAATVQSSLNLIRTIFQTASDNDKIPTNPVAGVRAPIVKHANKSRIPFSNSDLEAIFKSDIYTKNSTPVGGAGEAAYWIPLIALWSGARLEEIGQLHTADIQEEFGIQFIHITTEGGDKHIKTMSSKRKVPIHTELIKYGFLDYVKRIKKAGYKKVFPLITAPEGRPKTAKFSKWFGRHLRLTLKIEDPRKVFHSFRHGFKDACRISGVLSEHHDRLTGHSNNNVGDGYGGEYYPLKPLNEAIKKLAYEGLDLSHLYQK